MLATLARICDEAGANCFIVTGDKDCRQLITDRVAVFNIRKNQVFDAAALREDWGVGPDQVVDFQALVGDKVDNVPGVPGIGPKTAQQLLETYGTLDNLLGARRRSARRKGKKLVECREQALLVAPARAARHASADRARLGRQPRRRHRSRIAGRAVRRVRLPLVRRPRRENRADSRLPAPTTAEKANYHLVDTPEKLAELVAQLDKQIADQRRHRNDARARRAAPKSSAIPSRSSRARPTTSPSAAPPATASSIRKQTLEALRPVLENPNIRKLGQNLKYDMIVLRNVGVTLAGLAFDTMIASYLLDAGGRSHNLDDLAQRYLNHTTIKIDELIGKGRDQKRMDEVPVAQVATYAAEDADIPLRMQPILDEQARRNGAHQAQRRRSKSR